VSSLLCPLSSLRHLDQTQPDVPDEGEEGRLRGRVPGRKGDRRRGSRSAPPVLYPVFFQSVRPRDEREGEEPQNYKVTKVVLGSIPNVLSVNG